MNGRGLWLIGGAAVLLAFLGALALAPLPDGPSARERALAAPPPKPAPDGMVWVQGGAFFMGSEPPATPDDPDRLRPDEFPRHKVELDSFWMDATEVTNAQFAEFVEMTGFKTFAEKVPTREELSRSGSDMSLLPDSALIAASLTFKENPDRENLRFNIPQWEHQLWEIKPGADWRHPEGPDSNIEKRTDHPVVHVNWEDAVAYLTWAGKRLPTEAEFEYAARNGGKEMLYPWGNEREPAGTFMCNYWQGDFPLDRQDKDGYLVTAPIKTFKPNELGLYDISGNVWEWCQDFYRMDYYSNSPKRNPQGPDNSLDPDESNIIKRVQRGGSFLCNTNSCTGYRTTARMKGDFLTSTCHAGFRGVVDVAGYEAYQAAQAKISAWRAERKKAGL